MAHFVAYKAVDFTELPELLVLIQNPVYSGQSSTSFTATKGDASLKLAGVEFQYQGGEPTFGNIKTFEGFSEGNPTFRIDHQSFGFLQLVDRLTNGGIDVALDNIFNAVDVLDGSGFDDTLFGFDRADVLNGNQGDDILDGGSGGDVLDGGKGRDKLIGGGADDGIDGSDSFVFSEKAKKTNSDKVMDFLDGDLVHLDNAVFTKLKKDGPLKAKYYQEGSEADDGNDFVIYNSDSGKLFWDKDGDGDAGKKLIAAFKGKPDIDHDDILVI